MNCFDVANTGSPLMQVLAIGAMLVCAGLITLWLAHTQRTNTTVLAVLLALLVTCSIQFVMAGHSQARAAAPACVDGVAIDTSLRIVQTSTMTGLAPGVAPVLITGVIVNDGDVDIYVAAVTVKIESVTADLRAAAGTCDVTDYLLLDAVMPVDKSVAPGESLPFHGAAIGFRDKATNQDACQHAGLMLSYVSS